MLLEEVQQVVTSARDLPTHLSGGSNKVLHLLVSTLQSSLTEIPEPIAVQVSSTATFLPTTGLLNCNTFICLVVYDASTRSGHRRSSDRRKVYSSLYPIYMTVYIFLNLLIFALVYAQFAAASKYSERGLF